ncbi:MAG: DUF6512 family protein [Oscillospiraceae bacterium]|jgi:cation transport ATPase|nr:DUF6512 family protein [Oscillospiraceae bacterium]
MMNALAGAINRAGPIVKGRMSKKMKAVICAAVGVVVCFSATCVLHFSWEWMGKSLFAAVFSAVNESVWEHIKILCIPYLLWGAAEYYILRPDWKAAVTARSVGVICLIALSISTFYIYSGVWGSSVLWVDIALALINITISELMFHRTMSTYRESSGLFPVWLALLSAVVIMILCFTASPPQIGLFKDYSTGLFGLELRP